MANATASSRLGPVLPADRMACHCALLRRTARRVTALYDEALAPADLRLTQYSLLATVDRAGEIALTPLAGALGMERTTLTRNLAPLVTRKLVKLEASTGRTKLARLTARGAAALRQAYPYWLEAQRRFASELAPAESTALATLAAAAGGKVSR